MYSTRVSNAACFALVNMQHLLYNIKISVAVCIVG